MEDRMVDIGIGVIATLIGSGLLWIFRRRVREAIATLDISTGEILAWLMAFSILVAIVAPITDAKVKSSLIIVLTLIVIPMVWRLR